MQHLLVAAQACNTSRIKLIPRFSKAPRAVLAVQFNPDAMDSNQNKKLNAR